MGIIVSFSSSKGGVGKSSICVNLAGALTLRDKTVEKEPYRVLVIDLDSQGSASHHLAKKFSNFQGTISHVLAQEISLQQAIHQHSKLLHFIPCDRSIVHYTNFGQLDFSQELGRLMQRVVNHYDFIFLDIPPTLSTFTLVPLFVSDYVILPVSAVSGELSIHGVSEQLETINLVKQEDNPKLKPLGIVITMVGRTRLAKEVIQYIQKNHSSLLFKTRIPQSAKIAESSSIGTTIFSHGKKTIAAKAFTELAEEFLKKLKTRKEKK